MGMTLVIAEKPSVGRDIARVLGANKREDGYLIGETHIVSWAVGHLVALCEPDELDERYKRWSFDTLPILPETLPTKVIAKSKPQFLLLKKLMGDARVSDIVCATDSGREGELIFRWIYEKAGCRKPVRRLWISSMTDAAIRAGFEQLLPMSRYDALYESARLRSVADWLVGMNASRAFSVRFHARLSVGRVQTPTLKLLVDRALAIRAFVPEEYYEVRAEFGAYAGLWYDATAQSSRIDSRERAQQITREVSGAPARVESVEQEQMSVPPPQLFDLTTLQREANMRLKLTAEQTLAAAQALYETYKRITYPRTDSRYLPHDQRPELERSLGALPAAYAPYAQRVALPLPQLPRVFDDAKVSDHHAIVPVASRGAPETLPERERAVYDLIVRRTLAAFFPPHTYLSQRVLTRAATHLFISRGKAVLQQGFKEVYPDRAPARAASEDEGALPRLSVGDESRVVKASSLKRKTQPPQQLNDASLLAAMEGAGRELEDEALREQMKDSGLGTPATRAATIERLIDVGYARRAGKDVLATEKGELLIAVAPPDIASPETTGKWERALAQIARGQPGVSPERFMEGIRRYASFLVEHARDANFQVAFPAEAPVKGGKRAAPGLGKCPLCDGGRVMENSKAFYCSGFREGCAFKLWKDALERAGVAGDAAPAVRAMLRGKPFEGARGALSLEAGRLVCGPSAAASPARTALAESGLPGGAQSAGGTAAAGKRAVASGGASKKPAAPVAPTAPTASAASTARAAPAASATSTARAAPTASATRVPPTAPAAPAARATAAAPTARVAPAAPTASATSATSTARVAPTASAAPTAPAAPTARVAPIASAASTASTARVAPTASATSGAPTAPAASATSATRVPPAASATRVPPIAPATPTASAAPTARVASAAPTASATSATSTASTASAAPSAPPVPGGSAGPAKSGGPRRTAGATKPPKPGAPDGPTAPGGPGASTDP